MSELTKKRPTEEFEIRFRGSRAAASKLRQVAKTLKMQDVTQWALEEKDSLTLEELSPEMLWNSGGRCIRGARGREGMTQKQLAALIGISPRQLSEMEHGKRPIDKETAKKLAKALNAAGYRVFL